MRVSLATGYTNTRKGLPALSLHEVLRRDPSSAHLLCFRDCWGDLLNVIWHDDKGARLYTKRPYQGRSMKGHIQQ